MVGGGAGSGKTVFALQTLVNGARDHGEPGVFVAFEEDSKRIVTNADTLGWDLPSLQRDKLFFLDAQPSFDSVRSGQFDLGGMLAALGAKVDELGAKRIAFDAVDVVLGLLSDPNRVRGELYRLHEWLLRRGLTAVLTAKTESSDSANGTPWVHDFVQFMVDCSVALDHEIIGGVSQRNLQIAKYRGSGFEENETPFLIDSSGIEVAFVSGLDASAHPATGERVSSGVDRLDAMLGGGYHRGAGILLTGAPGTAKTTLCGTFAEAACRRGEKTLFASFDSRSDELIRNLASVAIDLSGFVDAGLLRFVSARALGGSAETHLMRIKAAAREHGARCVVVDPLSALSKSGNRGTSPGVALRLIDWAKAEGVTLMCTSLLNRDVPDAEGTPLQISTIADTWIHLSYLVRAGERNRGISIVKSRGTAHSNQVRELILSDSGVALADVYTADGEVLMGSLRWSKERAEQLAREADAAAARRRRLALEAEAEEIEAQIEALRRKFESNREERNLLADSERGKIDDRARAEIELRDIRSPHLPRTPGPGPALDE